MKRHTITRFMDDDLGEREELVIVDENGNELEVLGDHYNFDCPEDKLLCRDFKWTVKLGDYIIELEDRLKVAEDKLIELGYERKV